MLPRKMSRQLQETLWNLLPDLSISFHQEAMIMGCFIVSSSENTTTSKVAG